MTLTPNALSVVRLFSQAEPLKLSGGQTLGPVDVTYATYGELNADRSNAVFIAHALTGDANVHEWWASMVGPGKPIDTDEFFVIGCNILGGCQGTTGPSSINPATGAVYGLDFPVISVADVVSVHRALVAHLGIERLYAAIGGSLGGMQVLQWTGDAPSQIERAIVIAASAKLGAQNIALSSVARQAIVRDPDFHNGQYAEHGVVPASGLAVARMLGHITYVSEAALDKKFGRERRDENAEPHLGIDFQVESYLDYQGTSFLKRFDALSYLYLTRMLDYFDPFADPEFAARAAASKFQVISFDSDWRFSPAHSAVIAETLKAAGAVVEDHIVHSIAGHDSFLLEPPGYLDLVREFVANQSGKE